MINKIKVESHLKSSDHNVIRTSNALEVIKVKGNISKPLDFKIQINKNREWVNVEWVGFFFLNVD